MLTQHRSQPTTGQPPPVPSGGSPAPTAPPAGGVASASS